MVFGTSVREAALPSHRTQGPRSALGADGGAPSLGPVVAVVCFLRCSWVALAWLVPASRGPGWIRVPLPLVTSMRQPSAWGEVKVQSTAPPESDEPRFQSVISRPGVGRWDGAAGVLEGRVDGGAASLSVVNCSNTPHDAELAPLSPCVAASCNRAGNTSRTSTAAALSPLPGAAQPSLPAGVRRSACRGVRGIGEGSTPVLWSGPPRSTPKYTTSTPPALVCGCSARKARPLFGLGGLVPTFPSGDPLSRADLHLPSRLGACHTTTLDQHNYPATPLLGTNPPSLHLPESIVILAF